ncbi:MAG: AAA family ATPase, partial [Burkholderiaceae bacterium]
MLASLSVHQFVIVEQLDLDLASGFTVMTGETGAGKSILIDALDLLLGGRADSTVIRDGAQKAELAARFEIQNTPQARAWCEQAGIEPDDQQVLVRRVVDRTGKSRAWINGQPATLTQLKELGETLVDIHGQHAHQALLRPNAQRQLLDAHAELTDQVKSISDIWRAKEKLEALLAQAQAQAERLSLLRDQLNWKIEEISALRLLPGEWESLSEEQ